MCVHVCYRVNSGFGQETPSNKIEDSKSLDKTDSRSSMSVSHKTGPCLVPNS